MTKGLIGKKLGMTQVFSEEGVSVPVTVIEVEPSVIIQKKTKEKDGYAALQLGYGRIKQKNVTKALQGHFRKADKGLFRILREFRMDMEGGEPGLELKPEMFEPGDYVDIVGTTKGKGFAGVIKRHGFSGGRATHGSMFQGRPAPSVQVPIRRGFSKEQSFPVIWGAKGRQPRTCWYGLSGRK